MADYTIQPGEWGIHGVTLAAATVCTIRFPDDVDEIEVLSHDGAAAVYFTVDGTTPVVEGRGSRVIPAAISSAQVEPPHRRADCRQAHLRRGTTDLRDEDVMRRHVYTPKVPDAETDAMVKTLASSALAGNEEVAANLARQKAEQDARDAEMATRIATLADIASQLAPLQQSANVEHARLQALIDDGAAELQSLRSLIADAQADADSAGVQAQAAHTKASTALGVAQDSNALAVETATTSTTAKNDAATAKTAATAAQTDAALAQNAAGLAVAEAATAKTAASSALAAAQDAAGKATAANTTAATSKTTADTATTTATAAQTAASAASTKADQATSATTALAARTTTLENKTAALEARTLTLRRATPVLPLIALGATYDQAITWTTPMPDAAYTLELVPGAGLIGKATMKVKAGSQTASGVTIQVTAGVLLAAGQTVDVTAYRYA